MVHVSVFTFVLTFGWIACDVAVAADPVPAVAVSDPATASMLSSLPVGQVLGVVLQQKSDSDDVIDARALAMRHATHFIYHSDYESSLSAMYRQRLQAQGAIAVDLREYLPRQNRNMIPASTHPKKSLVTLLSTNP